MSRSPTWRVPFVDLAAQQAALAGDLSEAVTSALTRTDWILGEDVALFEQEFAAYCGARWSVGTDSGMSALELSLRAFGIGAGDEVITAANTFAGTALAISHAGATPVLVDIDPATYTIDPAQIEEAITSRTRAVIPVHLYGQPADMDAVTQVARQHDLVVIEDACQAHGARYRGKPVGSLGDVAAFSFYPSKNLGALGDGGIIVGTGASVLQAARVLRNYGQWSKYAHVVKGFNRRLDTLQARVLRVKLRYLDRWNAARRRHAALYDELLRDSGVVTPTVREDAEPVWHLYVVRTPQRDALRAALASAGIETGIHYPTPVHLQAAYRDLAYPAGSFPVAERCADEVLSLPLYPELPSEAIERAAAVVHDFFQEPGKRAIVLDGPAAEATRPQRRAAATPTTREA